MKSRLFATLLALTTVVSLAQQPSKTELLTHLKNVRNEIQTTLKEIPTEEALKSEWGTENFLFLLNLFNEISAIYPTENTKNIEELYLTHICEMNNLDKTAQAFNDAQLASAFYSQQHDPEYSEKKQAEIATIFDKHHQAYCLQYPNGILYDLKVDECVGNLEYHLVNLAQRGRELFEKLLPKIDAKIKELETQA